MLPVAGLVFCGVKVIVTVLVARGAIPPPPASPPPENGGLGCAAIDMPVRSPLPTFLRIRFACPCTPTPVLVIVSVLGTESLPGSPTPVTGIVIVPLLGSLLVMVIIAPSEVPSGTKVTVSTIGAPRAGIANGPGGGLRVNAVPG